MKCCLIWGEWPNHLFEWYTLCLCTDSEEEGGEGSAESSASVFIVREDKPLSFMFLHLVLLSCVCSVYKGQMSPNIQHLVFLDVKEVASV